MDGCWVLAPAAEPAAGRGNLFHESQNLTRFHARVVRFDRVEYLHLVRDASGAQRRTIVHFRLVMSTFVGNVGWLQGLSDQNGSG